MKNEMMEQTSAAVMIEDEPADLRSRVRAYERGLILAALEATGGNQRQAAARLGLLATTFHEKLKRYGLRPRPSAEGEDE
ncbi:MAG TPA: helix-turn-helix domain-containing protein [Vicinamibacteria bacterium]|nr:helix-turn-helix domain-containing protein [Vicinamibacteria bacterium]